MNTKTCTKCGEKKEATTDFFYKQKRGKYGLRADCKVCSREDQVRRLREKNPPVFEFPASKVCTGECGKEYMATTEFFFKKEGGKYGLKAMCKTCNNISSKHHDNKPETKQRRRKRHKERQQDDLRYKLTKALRSRLYKTVEGNSKSASTLELVGCTLEYLKNHLESQFTDGMSWDNYGKYGWHIDHIIPCASFDLTDPAQQRECFHFSNLQPLWAKDNWSKGAKLEAVH
jgi:hypothetical protein